MTDAGKCLLSYAKNVHDLTPNDLASLAHRSRQYIHQLCSGQATITLRQALFFERLIGIDANTLVGLECDRLRGQPKRKRKRAKVKHG